MFPLENCVGEFFFDSTLECWLFSSDIRWELIVYIYKLTACFKANFKQN